LGCGECGWTITILADTDAELTQCPWCGWDDLEISELERVGVGQRILCATHGEIVVEILEHTISIDDFFNELYCPFCART